MKVKRKNCQYLYYSLSKFIEGAWYFDQGVFSNGNGLDTPLSHPLVDNNTVSDFGFKFLSAQDISETVFRISDTDNGNKDRVPHLFMTFWTIYGSWLCLCYTSFTFIDWMQEQVFNNIIRKWISHQKALSKLNTLRNFW